MSDFNLSKTEFIAYLTCPLKFYLIKSMNQGIAYGPRGERDYSDFPEDTKDGMKWHSWFEVFHDDYFKMVRENKPAPTSEKEVDTKIMKLFFEKELDRYKEHSEFWFPLATEIYLESVFFRGEIDRIDQLNDQGDCLLIEYKRNKNEFDEQELLFYACLINQIGGNIPEVNCPIRIKEIEIYYYKSGEIKRRKLLERELENFEEYMKSITKEIFSPNWVRNENCDILNSNCKFKMICKQVPNGLLKPGKSQKTEE